MLQHFIGYGRLFDNSAIRGEIAVQDNEVTLGLDGIRQRPNDDLVFRVIGYALEILDARTQNQRISVPRSRLRPIFRGMKR